MKNKSQKTLKDEHKEEILINMAHFCIDVSCRMICLVITTDITSQVIFLLLEDAGDNVSP